MNSFVAKEEMYRRDVLHLSGKGAAILPPMVITRASEVCPSAVM